MKNYIVSGFMEEVGAAQLTIEAKDEKQAKEIATERYGFDDIVSISEYE